MVAAIGAAIAAVLLADRRAAFSSRSSSFALTWFHIRGSRLSVLHTAHHLSPRGPAHRGCTNQVRPSHGRSSQLFGSGHLASFHKAARLLTVTDDGRTDLQAARGAGSGRTAGDWPAGEGCLRGEHRRVQQGRRHLGGVYDSDIDTAWIKRSVCCLCAASPRQSRSERYPGSDSKDFRSAEFPVLPSRYLAESNNHCPHTIGTTVPTPMVWVPMEPQSPHHRNRNRGAGWALCTQAGLVRVKYVLAPSQ